MEDKSKKNMLANQKFWGFLIALSNFDGGGNYKNKIVYNRSCVKVLYEGWRKRLHKEIMTLLT